MFYCCLLNCCIGSVNSQPLLTDRKSYYTVGYCVKIVRTSILSTRLVQFKLLNPGHDLTRVLIVDDAFRLKRHAMLSLTMHLHSVILYH